MRVFDVKSFYVILNFDERCSGRMGLEFVVFGGKGIDKNYVWCSWLLFLVS